MGGVPLGHLASYRSPKNFSVYVEAVGAASGHPHPKCQIVALLRLATGIFHGSGDP